jgi:hypothetical protein
MDPLLQFGAETGSSEHMKQKWKLTLKLVLQKSMHLAALETLRYDAPCTVIKHVVGQFSKVSVLRFNF